MTDDSQQPLIDRLIYAVESSSWAVSAQFGDAPRFARRMIERDLAWLLNTDSLECHLDLDGFPEVRTSVLNYGMPALSGQFATSIDPVVTARRIRDAIAAFEPRMRRVRVSPIKTDSAEPKSSLRFRIEAEYTSLGNVEPVVVDTRIALDTGDFEVAPMRSG